MFALDELRQALAEARAQSRGDAETTSYDWLNADEYLNTDAGRRIAGWFYTAKLARSDAGAARMTTKQGARTRRRRKETA